jgi:Na+/proline symporter
MTAYVTFRALKSGQLDLDSAVVVSANALKEPPSLLAVGLEPFSAIPAARLDPFSGGSTALALIEEWAIPICGSVVAAELVSRVISARSPEVARRSSLLAGGGYLILGLIPVTIGLAGSVLLPGLADSEQVLPLLAQRLLPGALYVILAGALISAILSTVDTTLLVCSSLVSHNLILPARPHLGEQSKVRIARAGVAVFGVLAYIIALHAEGVYALVEEASSFGSAGIFTVVTIGLFTTWGRAGAAIASLLGGVITWVLGAYVLGLALPYLTSLLVSVAAYAAVALLQRKGPQAILRK